MALRLQYIHMAGNKQSLLVSKCRTGLGGLALNKAFVVHRLDQGIGFGRAEVIKYTRRGLILLVHARVGSSFGFSRAAPEKRLSGSLDLKKDLSTPN